MDVLDQTLTWRFRSEKNNVIVQKSENKNLCKSKKTSIGFLKNNFKTIKIHEQEKILIENLKFRSNVSGMFIF